MWIAFLALVFNSWAAQDSLRQGLEALNRNELAVARQQLESASKLQPDDPRVWLGLAQTYWKSGQKEPATTAAARAASLGSSVPPIQHGLALFFASTGEWEKAAEFESRYAAATGDPQATGRAASLYLQAGKPEPAVGLLLPALEKDNRADHRNLLGKAYEAAGDSIRALAELQEAVRLNPYEESYHFDLAQMLMAHHNFDIAIQVLESSKKIFAKSAQLELALGVAYYGQRRFEDAVDAFLRTIDISPEVPQPYLYLARILESAAERLPEVEQKFAHYVTLKPSNPLAYYLHAKVLLHQLPPKGYPETAVKAEALVRKSLSIKEDEWESHLLLGTLLERKEDFPASRAALERSIALNPKAPAPHLPLARVLLRLGLKEEAARERNLFKEITYQQEMAVQERASQIKRLKITNNPQ